MSEKKFEPEVMPAFFNRRASEKELRVLLVADVHCALSNVHRLAELLTSRGEYVDMIWVAGDLTLLHPHDFEVPARLAASEGDMSAVISALENIQCRVAYVPGSNDPVSTTVLDCAGPRLTAHSCNLHGRCLRVAPDLVLVGYGGNVTLWGESDHRRLGALLAPAVGAEGVPRTAGVDTVMPRDAVVLVTHSRPSDDVLGDPAAQESIVIGVHGGVGGSTQPAAPQTGGDRKEATEAGEPEAAEQLSGVERIGKVGFVGGGSLSEGDFCLITLGRKRRPGVRESGWRLTRYKRMSVHTQ